MKFTPKFTNIPLSLCARVGNVYAVRGGSGSKFGHMMILFAINDADMCLFIVVDNSGKPVGVNYYGRWSIEERQPIGFVAGLEDISLEITSL